MFFGCENNSRVKESRRVGVLKVNFDETETIKMNEELKNIAKNIEEHRRTSIESAEQSKDVETNTELPKAQDTQTNTSEQNLTKTEQPENIEGSQMPEASE